MKKIFIFILLTVISIGTFSAPNAQAFFRINEESKDTEYVEGIRHTKIVGTINDNGKETRQVMNYISANVRTNEDINIVVGDNYSLHQDENDKWGMHNLHAIMENVHSRNPHFEIIAGVNGDFYDINDTGRPSSTFIRDFEVINPGTANNRHVVGFKDNGELVSGIPQFNGYELIVYNDEGQLKLKLDVDHINEDPKNDDEISVYFDNYLNAIPSEYNKVYIDGIETKLTEAQGNYFGKGILDQTTTEALNIKEHQFVIAGHEFNNDQLITETDYVVVQKRVTGVFEGVRSVIGAWNHPLVVDGEVNPILSTGNNDKYPAPRTAVGVKTDGTVFFIVIDGRNKPNGMEGTTLKETGEVMAALGAVQAFNLDGGGSSTMALKDSGEALGYRILNTPSDGRLRSVSNGVFFVKGNHKVIPEAIPAWPDTRDQLAKPSNIFIDANHMLRFNEVSGSISYSVLIDGVETIIEDNELQLGLDVGLHEISVRAKGGASFKSSDYTNPFLHQVYPHEINLLIDMIKGFAKYETNRG